MQISIWINGIYHFEHSQYLEYAFSLFLSFSFGLLVVVTPLFSSPVLPAGTIQISNSDGVNVSQGLQTLTMTNASPSTTSAATGATIVQYAQGPDGQFFIPGESHWYQIKDKHIWFFLIAVKRRSETRFYFDWIRFMTPIKQFNAYMSFKEENRKNDINLNIFISFSSVKYLLLFIDKRNIYTGCYFYTVKNIKSITCILTVWK